MSRDPSAPTEKTPDPSHADDPARDALADVLRVLGQYAFDVDETEADDIRQAFDGWARHALLGTPRPGIDSADAARRSNARDWRGLSRFASDHRQQESEYVVRSLHDLRDVIWMFVHGVARSVNEDANADETISQRLRTLRESIDSNDTANLKRHALASIGLVEEAIDRRRRRQQEQIEALSERIRSVRDELASAREQLERDSLTGLFGRAALDEYLQRVAELGVVSGHPATLFMIDCDDFKWVNDTFGHPGGDEVLKALAEAMSTVFRRASDFVARYGGDEFSIVVPNGKVEEIHALGEALLHEVRNIAVARGDETIRVGVSIGAARLVPGEDKQRWVERADRALYDAKDAGRDRLCVADVSLEP